MRKIEISISSFVKAIIIIIIGLLLIVPKVVFASSGKLNADVVRIRESSSTDSEVLGVLDVNDVVEILGEQGDWYKINSKGTIGYVSKSFITINDETNNTTTENPVNETQNSNTTVSKIYKIAENCNVNILPIITSEQIGEIKKDEQVSLVINAGLWAYIKNDNISGWIRLDKLSAEDVIITNNSDNQEKGNTQQNDNQANNDEQNNSNQTTNETKIMYATSSGINVRSEPNTTCNALDSLGVNSEVKIIGEENEWYKVQVNGNTGFIRKDLLSDKKTEVTSRSNELDRSAVIANNKSGVTDNGNQQQTIVTTGEVPVSSSGVTGNDIVGYAQQFLGCSYVYGAAGPYSFDCSGLTMYVYSHFGYSLSHSSRVQATQGVPVDINNLQPGDILVFSNDGKNVGHVGIYIGNDKFIHASDSTTGVIISNLHDRWNISKYVGARRIL